MYCQSNNWWIFRKILWSSQNIWTLLMFSKTLIFLVRYSTLLENQTASLWQQITGRDQRSQDSFSSFVSFDAKSAVQQMVQYIYLDSKVEKILKSSLDSIPSPSTSVKIQIMGRKEFLWCKGKALLGVVNKCLKTKSLLTSPSSVLPYYFK